MTLQSSSLLMLSHSSSSRDLYSPSQSLSLFPKGSLWESTPIHIWQTTAGLWFWDVYFHLY